MSERDAIVRVENVSKRFTTRDGLLQVLQSISFTVSDGELVAIVGPSGCGKSTLLRIILGAEQANEGTVWLDEDVRRNSLAVISQDASVLPWRTLLQNACLGLE